MEYLTITLSSYLLGSIPFGFILTKIFLKQDIRDIGSGNIGATNTLRTGNKLLGYSTLALDISKAILPVLYVKFNHPDYIFIASLCTFLGHVFPVWLKFKGGKGVATYIGILFSINLIYGFIFIIGWLTTFLNSNRFKFIMTRYDKWVAESPAILFPSEPKLFSTQSFTV